MPFTSKLCERHNAVKATHVFFGYLPRGFLIAARQERQRVATRKMSQAVRPFPTEQQRPKMSVPTMYSDGRFAAEISGQAYKPNAFSARSALRHDGG
jgi:hypothetical protein